MALWSWNEQSRRYTVTAEGAARLGQRPGTFVSGTKLVAFRDDYIADRKEVTNELAQRLASGDISLQRWVLDMREAIKTAHINEYMLARGGRNAMTPADWGRVGGTVQGQYRYLDNFANQIGTGDFTEASIASRSRMYMEAAGTSFERAKVAQRKMPDLPDYPGAGNTQCLSNCKCQWVIRETSTSWECTWKLSPAEHCDDCIANADRWSPYVIAKTQASTRSMAEEMLTDLTSTAPNVL